MKKQKNVRSQHWASVLALVAAGCAAFVPGCSDSDEGGESGTSTACLDNRAYFAKEAWSQVFTQCSGCHAPGGQANQEGARLELLPASYPGFIDANLKSIELLAKTEFEGKSILLRKPLGEMDHGGGKQLTSKDGAYKSLTEMVKRIRSGDDPCGGKTTVTTLGGIEMLDAQELFRKATLHLASRLPTAKEIQALQDADRETLVKHLDGLMEEDAFYDRLKEIYNDRFLTDRYLRYNGYALNILNADDFPKAREAYDNGDNGSSWTDDEKRMASEAVARQPLELIAYIVKNDKPFTEIITADYTVFNYWSALVMNADIDLDSFGDYETDFKPGKIRIVRDGKNVTLPHAGVITSPMFLNRFPTTETNRNRHRARMVMDFFLATDILKVAERPIDADDASKYANPTVDDPNCAVCHTVMDPIAGAFQKWDDNDQEEYQPDREWHKDMFAPGYGKEQMSIDDFPNAQQWVAERIVKDDRFPLSVVYTMHKALTGHDPLIYPAADSENFEQELKAWEAQDTLFRGIITKFVDAKYNLKVVIRELLLSPYFRAKNATGVTAEKEVELATVGTGKLLPPEALDRKIEAVFGVAWTRNAPNRNLTNDYRILYGGIDSDTVTKRLTTANGVMANVAWRMANEMACKMSAYDFTRSPKDRWLFPFVTTDHVPEADTGGTIPDNVDAIKRNIQYLHGHMLGENLELGDAEIERTYKLFYETWKEGFEKVGSDELSSNLTYSCQGRIDYATGEDYPDDKRLNSDENYSIRAWMAVITYLASDFKFLYE